MSIAIKTWFKTGGWINILFLAVIVYIVNEVKSSMAAGYVSQPMFSRVNAEQDRRIDAVERIGASSQQEFSELKALVRENNALLKLHLKVVP